MLPPDRIAPGARTYSVPEPPPRPVEDLECVLRNASRGPSLKITCVEENDVKTLKFGLSILVLAVAPMEWVFAVKMSDTPSLDSASVNQSVASSAFE